jgi:16S rRNA (cytidine1402-2'-O)-methyltransferase
MGESSTTVLYLVPTPIGNLADLTFRALEILKSVDTILAEDTRTSSVLLKHYQISKRLESFHNFNEHKRLEHIIQRLTDGEKMALISDAGTPGISDPGFLLARACIQEGLPMECLPGPTAFVPALLKSGLPADRFAFEGFLPQKKGRSTLLALLKYENRTMIFYESPYRVLKTLKQFGEVFGDDRRASVSRELTKKFEETINGTISELYSKLKDRDIKGEIVMVVEGYKGKTTSRKSQEEE